MKSPSGIGALCTGLVDIRGAIATQLLHDRLGRWLDGHLYSGTRIHEFRCTERCGTGCHSQSGTAGIRLDRRLHGVSMAAADSGLQHGVRLVLGTGAIAHRMMKGQGVSAQGCRASFPHRTLMTGSGKSMRSSTMGLPSSHSVSPVVTSFSPAMATMSPVRACVMSFGQITRSKGVLIHTSDFCTKYSECRLRSGHAGARSSVHEVLQPDVNENAVPEPIAAALPCQPLGLLAP